MTAHRFLVQTYINDGPGRFWEYEPGDILSPGPVLAFDVNDEAAPHPMLGTVSRSIDTMEHIALDSAWAVGNRMASDHDGLDWPSTVRSLSVGDVLVIGETAWAVAKMGFQVISGADLARSLGPDALISDRGTGPWTRSLTA